MTNAIQSLISPMTTQQFYTLEKETGETPGWLHLIENRNDAEKLFQAAMDLGIGKTLWHKLHLKSVDQNELAAAVAKAVVTKQQFFLLGQG